MLYEVAMHIYICLFLVYCSYGQYHSLDILVGSFHLFLGPLSLHRDGVVCPVVRLSAEHAHTHLILFAEQLQEPFMLRTHPVLHVCNGLHYLVLGEPGRVRLQVLLAVRRQTHKAGFDRFGPALPQTHITKDFLP